MKAGLRLDSVGATHVGRVRTNNEDSYCLSPERCLWLVADGMGGHEKGEWASSAIVQAAEALRLPGTFEAACTAIADMIHASNARIHREAEQRGIQMGSTIVGLHLSGAKFGLFWVGDSRAYVLRAGALHQLTRDHSQVQAMVDRGLIRPEEAVGHPMSHVLARAVGVQPVIEVDAIVDEAQPGDVFLLCSDGLTNRVSNAEIATMLEGYAHQEALDRLICLTLERGAPDNVTAIIVGVHETTQLSLAPAGAMQP
ncbi:PP2C family protein-serine/threonine phosphatase [Sphingomonas sp. S2-65]|uniref:PP2C family protein-serine/threonine phosphatase n=1 Tax=Sphingomonas sp. S2-65 TaxID=2903960 RepID=UPI001F333854|nr:protein phosphatase 2C domain-containing protein [Sphingomonas sp. S2-65]UYY57208.1 protein phosphatase 2C domain-containing protein [Sphingomonas sp. S2-65]